VTTKGCSLVVKERIRQIEKEGWSRKHDDSEHTGGELLRAGILYAAQADANDLELDDVIRVLSWPWDKESDKRAKHSPLRCLIIGAALLIAEIDRRTALGEKP
jgi:hypothetical protein